MCGVSKRLICTKSLGYSKGKYRCGRITSTPVALSWRINRDARTVMRRMLGTLAFSATGIASKTTEGVFRGTGSRCRAFVPARLSSQLRRSIGDIYWHA
jgi:hypothetical protein